MRSTSNLASIRNMARRGSNRTRQWKRSPAHKRQPERPPRWVTRPRRSASTISTGCKSSRAISSFPPVPAICLYQVALAMLRALEPSPGLPTPDSPLGGYAYQSSACAGTPYPLTAACLASFPVQDYWSTYWDEYFWHPLGSGYYIARPSSPQYLTQYRTANNILHMTDTRGIDPGSAYGFSFSDVPGTNFVVPGGTQNESINFVTALVGVTGSCNVLVSSNCAFQIFPGSTFKWTSTSGAVNFTAAPGTSPSFASLTPAEGAHPQHNLNVEAETVVNPRDLTGAELESSIISVDQFLAAANLTPATLASMGGGVSIFSASLVPSEAAALATALAETSTTTTVTLSPSGNLTPGEAATAIATVQATSGGAIPTGTVTFASPEFGTVLKVALNNGKAVVHFNAPSAGTYMVTATYNGSSIFSGSASAPYTGIVGASTASAR